MVLGTSSLLVIAALVTTIGPSLNIIQTVLAQSPPPPPPPPPPPAPLEGEDYPDVTNTGSYLDDYPLYDYHEPSGQYIEIWPEFSKTSTGGVLSGSGAFYYGLTPPRMYVFPHKYKNSDTSARACYNEWLRFILAREEHGNQKVWARPLSPLMVIYLYQLKDAIRQLRAIESHGWGYYGDSDAFNLSSPPVNELILTEMQHIYRTSLNRAGLYASAIRQMRLMEPAFTLERKERWANVQTTYASWLQCNNSN
jgi:hypothetical protein